MILTDQITASHIFDVRMSHRFHRHNTRLPNQVSGLATMRASPESPGLSGVAVASRETPATLLLRPVADEGDGPSVRRSLEQIRPGVAKYIISDD